MKLEPKDRIIVALDVDSIDAALEIVEELKDHVGLFKVGLELISTIFVRLLTPHSLTEAVISLHKAMKLFALLRGRTMLDAKFKDIPNAMAGASAAVTKLGATLFTVHASAGVEGMSAAVGKAGNAKVLAVTVLTSMDEDECVASYGTGSLETVLRFVRLAKAAGVHGIVCAPRDAEFFLSPERAPAFEGIEFVCPNIRPAWAETGDQNAARAMTPGEAVKVGIGRMVIGRPIINPPREMFATRRAAAIAITEEIAGALAS